MKALITRPPFGIRVAELMRMPVKQVVLRRLLPSKGQLMLELGAGAGRNTKRYEGYERVVLLDYSRSQLQQAKDRLGAGEKYTYVAADVYKLPFVEWSF